MVPVGHALVSQDRLDDGVETLTTSPLLPLGFRTIMVGSVDRVTQGFVLAGAWLQLLALLLLLGWFVVRRGPR